MPGGAGHPTPGYNNEPETVTVTEYTNPVVHSGYDPDGLQELFEEEYIDWDAFEWDTWNWVINQPEGDGDDDDDGDAGPLPVGSIQDGADINFDYYLNDPLYQMAFANMAADDDDFSINDIDLDDLKEATKTIVETYRSVMGDKYRPPWKQDLPEKFVPTEMKTTYKTPFKMPNLVHPTIAPIMSPKLANLKKRSGAWHEAANRELQNIADRTPSESFSQEWKEAEDARKQLLRDG